MFYVYRNFLHFSLSYWWR